MIILVVSENLNSSSFIRPSQPNFEQRGPPSEEIRREPEADEEGTLVQDLKTFDTTVELFPCKAGKLSSWDLRVIPRNQGRNHFG